MTTDTTTGTDQSTVTADAGAGDTAKPTILGAAPDGEAGKTADEAGKTADDAADGTTAGKDGDAKPDEAKGDGDKPNPDDKKDEQAGPPEKYEFTLPDGVELDAALVEKADPVFRELGLTNEQANKLAALVAEQRVSEGRALQDAYEKQIEDWGTATYSDPELGGSAEAVTENVEKYAFPFIGKFGTPELKKLLADTGVGSHPEIVRVFVRAGKAMAEDGGVTSRSSTTQKSAGEVLFNHPTSQHKR